MPASGHAAHAAAIATIAATAVTGQRERAWFQNAILALSALPNGRMTSGSAPISRIACTLFSRPSTHNPAAAASASGRARLAWRPAAIRIINAKMTGSAATSSLRRMRECTATPPENAKASVASNATRQSRRMKRASPANISTQPVATRNASTRAARTADVMAASKAEASAADGIAGSV